MLGYDELLKRVVDVIRVDDPKLKYSFQKLMIVDQLKSADLNLETLQIEVKIDDTEGPGDWETEHLVLLEKEGEEPILKTYDGRFGVRIYNLLAGFIDQCSSF